MLELYNSHILYLKIENIEFVIYFRDFKLSYEINDNIDLTGIKFIEIENGSIIKVCISENAWWKVKIIKKDYKIYFEQVAKSKEHIDDLLFEKNNFKIP